MSWEEEVSTCIKCGSCLSVCPIYLETGQETLVARGKLALLAANFSNLLSADRQLYELLSNCLLCGACAENCAGGVRADDLIQKGRSLLMGKAGPGFWKKLLAREILPFPERLKILEKGQKLLFKKIPEERGLKLRFSSDPRTWPALTQPFFLDRKDLPAPPPEASSRLIGFFVGCSTNYLYPEVGEATLKLLRPMGNIILPRQQTCCGLPAFALGDMKTARDLARRNVLAFSEDRLEAIAVACSSCASHIKTAYQELLAEETALEPKVQTFIRKVEELSRFISKRDLTLAPITSPQIVAFHDPCHAKRKLKIANEPRELLRSRPGLSLVELKGNRCCGHGGLFNLSHPEISQKILEHPLTDLDHSGAEVLVTSCMACLMQFKLGVQRTGRKVKIKHWAELMV
ncbi:MAG: (Fe-S)-binding protein [Pseudomonadota bacterium]